MFIVFKSAVAFFFLFSLHGTFNRRTKLNHIAYNAPIYARFNGVKIML